MKRFPKHVNSFTPYVLLAFLPIVLLLSLVLAGCENVRPWGYSQGRHGVAGLGVRVPLDRPHSARDLAKDDSVPSKVFVGQVISVHDGDTLTISLNGQNTQARLIGIIAPSLDQASWGELAREALETLVAGKVVQLETDITDRDQTGQLLSYIFVGETFVNLELIRKGMAVVETVPPNVAHVKEYQQAQEEARRAGRGVWDPSNPLTVSLNCDRGQQKGQACIIKSGNVESSRPDFLP